MIRLFLIPALVALVLTAPAQDQMLRDSLKIIAADAKGTVGVALELADPPASPADHFIGLNEQRHFPMQSVYKFPLAICVLHKVDRGELSLDQKLHIGKKDWGKLYSPLRDQYNAAEVDLSLREILAATVTKSDNVGCDVLFRLLGGPANVQSFIRGLGVTDIAIATTEEDQSRSWDIQYRNWCTPAAMTRLLKLVYGRKAGLSEGATRLLLQMMEATTTGLMRIVHLLPAGITVAHKTGTSNTNPDGITAATNDVGIIDLPAPAKGHLLIAVFVSDAAADEDTRERVIARIARLAYNFYVRDSRR